MTEKSVEAPQIKERLSGLITFIEYLDVPSSAVWQHQKDLHLQDFIQRVEKNIGYKLSVDEMSALRNISDNEPPIIKK